MIAVVLVVAVATTAGAWLTWLGRRHDRLVARCDGAWAVLDAHLARRAAAARLSAQLPVPRQPGAEAPPGTAPPGTAPPGTAPPGTAPAGSPLDQPGPPAGPAEVWERLAGAADASLAALGAPLGDVLTDGLRRRRDDGRERVENELSRALRLALAADPRRLATAAPATTSAAASPPPAGTPRAPGPVGPPSAEVAAAAELRAAIARVVVARRFHNDAVRDVRALRRRPMLRLTRIGAGVPLPDYFEIDDAGDLVAL